MKKKPVKSQPFSPALNGLVEAFIASANQQVVRALEQEALHLQLPAGTRFDVQKRVWLLPQ